MSYTYEYKMPAVTVDAVIIKHRPSPTEIGEYESRILLIKRKNDPYKDHWAFPGGFVDEFEEPVTACIREVREETSIVLPHKPILFHAAGQAGRDPRGWVIALAFWVHVPWDTVAKANDDAIEYGWFDTNELPAMAFDHRQTFEMYRKIRAYLARPEKTGA